MNKKSEIQKLEEFGRIRLSDSFFMRDFLYSEISQIERIPNIPRDPKWAEEVGKKLCTLVLEPIQEKFGRISIRSAYRSCEVNNKGAENGNQYGCAKNESNYAGHIWDEKDKDGNIGATACIIVNAFIPYFERTKNWTALAWWIHDNIPEYSEMEFYKNYAAFNITWSSSPKKKISSYVAPQGTLTKPGMANFEGRHDKEYEEFLKEFQLKT